MSEFFSLKIISEIMNLWYVSDRNYSLLTVIPNKKSILHTFTAVFDLFHRPYTVRAISSTGSLNQMYENFYSIEFIGQLEVKSYGGVG